MSTRVLNGPAGFITALYCSTLLRLYCCHIVEMTTLLNANLTLVVTRKGAITQCGQDMRDDGHVLELIRHDRGKYK